MCSVSKHSYRGSQIDVKPIKDYDQFVGKTMEFKIVKINHEFKNVVVSHKALIEADIEGQKKRSSLNLKKVRYLKVLLRTLLLTVYSSTLEVLTVLSTLQTFLGLELTILQKFLKMDKLLKWLSLTSMMRKQEFS